MSRFLICPIGLVILMNLSAAPIPKITAKELPLYFPTKVGSKWVYESGNEETTYVVTSAEYKMKEGVWIVAVGRENERRELTPDKEWEVSDKGLILTKSATSKERLTWRYLALPHKRNSEWDLMPENERYRCVALDPQRVKVPAGEFDAVGVELYLDKLLFETHWYAPGVGLVKRTNNEKTTLQLKSFTVGKG